MGSTAQRIRHNRTITVDFQDEATYFRLLDDSKAFVECVLCAPQKFHSYPLDVVSSSSDNSQEPQVVFQRNTLP